MKGFTLLIVFSILLCGCARKSELEAARANLAEAQKAIETLEKERVPRPQYDDTAASLKMADEKIAVLERELKLSQELIAAQEKAKRLAEQVSESEASGVVRPTGLDLAKGSYESANETYVYSPDAQLNFGRHLQISSPTGLMVTDPEQKIVGGDLNIKAKGMSLETNDGLLTAAPDGSVKFTGKTLTMKFEDKKTVSDATAAASTTSPAEDTTPATAATPTPTPTSAPTNAP